MKQSLLVQAGRYAALVIILILTLFPILWIMLTAFKGPQEISAVPPIFFIRQPTLANFSDAFGFNIHVALGNSVIVASVTTALSMILSVPAAYAFARYPFPGSQVLLTAVLMVRMIPGIALIIPFFRLMNRLNLLNTHSALIITYLSFQIPFAIWLMESFFRALPRELEEAAMMDGCSRFGAFWSIICPLAAVGLATTAIFCAIASWNEFLYAVTLTRTSVSQTGPVAISAGVTSYQIFWGRMAASATIYVLPVLMFNLLLQRFIVQGITIGAVKG